MTIATINGIDIFFEVTGQGEPLVLVHGSWGDHTDWDAVVPAQQRGSPHRRIRDEDVSPTCPGSLLIATKGQDYDLRD